MHPMLNIAIRAARKAGNLILRESDKLDTLSISDKGYNDFVSEVDLASENEIIHQLQSAYPNHGILSEEKGYVGNPESDYLWIIDPLDGTNNFIHGIPHYCVSIGLQHQNKIILGVIYNPNLDHLFYASKGDGAQLNSRRIRVAQRQELKGCLFSASYGLTTNRFKNTYKKVMSEMKPQIAGFRYSGSLALDLAYVAAGFYDASWTTSSKAWDIAAAAILIQEAGGVVTEINGGSQYMKSGRILAGNPKIVTKLINTLSPTLQPKPKK
jgi:myo-inositol-1(or 4)-monophosphatase